MKKQIQERIPIFLPFQPISKGIVNADADVVGKDITDFDVNNMVIEGVAATPDLDLDNQKMLPSGFILDYFLKSGFINWNHQMSVNPDSIIGQPIEAKVLNNEFKLKGKLFSWSNLAKDIYKLAINLQNDENSDRTLGYSVEGLGVEENDGIVTKTIITSCAVAPVPKNNNTFLKICKGITVDEIRDIRKNLILSPIFVEIEKGVKKKCFLDIKLKENRIILDENYNFEVLKYDNRGKMSMSEALITLSKAVQSGYIKKDKVEELKKCVKKARLKVN